MTGVVSFLQLLQPRYKVEALARELTALSHAAATAACPNPSLVTRPAAARFATPSTFAEDTTMSSRRLVLSWLIRHLTRRQGSTLSRARRLQSRPDDKRRPERAKRCLARRLLICDTPNIEPATASRLCISIVRRTHPSKRCDRCRKRRPPDVGATTMQSEARCADALSRGRSMRRLAGP